MPKSPSAALPSAASQTLPGLTSRWTTPWACAWASATATSRPIRSASASVGRPRRAGRPGSPAHRAQDEIRDAVELARVVDGDHIRVVAEPAGDPDLALEPRERSAATEHDRQRDLAIQPLVVGEVDLLGRAVPEPAADVVAPRDHRPRRPRGAEAKVAGSLSHPWVGPGRSVQPRPAEHGSRRIAASTPPRAGARTMIRKAPVGRARRGARPCRRRTGCRRRCSCCRRCRVAGRDSAC